MIPWQPRFIAALVSLASLAAGGAAVHPGPDAAPPGAPEGR